MPTALPARRRAPADFAVLHLVIVPLAMLLLSTLLHGEEITVTTVLRTLLRGAEAIAEAELGFGRGWMIGHI
ncbi:hypothetical protein JQ557_18295 [Bradyrhizobium sp. U87765 SZCCT0131]|uniref:hypothetical protein n=1 Tax=unclassified Bradyrhizobium TaxID=2631580 RepID=UPI001BA6E583|nr:MULTISPECIES: hypothetical protein [unclassified Bradyrhizobium]MBR1219963.1 hypothetical protein [Bradyrhizobium sp. U87765 SZCCT0131]MBR1263581.1 hypothetical protein [Bradyrhizobium sp. U87765 SZCCT0134]MBR1309150.1 hypothetical protein [Bradyrhizobium sp. U87765 SZCCT0110]MBR1323913.1 hypothetical protein [Bradyrhizobium sp. U87765 SZCCT0109]MBR1349465.1 hypothetical protein [Bradyrhizobium sp. U87765 SZCCT0048]